VLRGVVVEKSRAVVFYRETGSMAEPGSAPPIPDGPVGGIYEGGSDKEPDEEMGSAGFWDSLSELSIAGMTVTPEQAKKIIYGILAVLVLLVLAVVAMITQPPPPLPPPPSPTGVGGGGAAPPPPRGDGGRRGAISFTAQVTSDVEEVGGAQWVVYGSECSVAAASSTACGGTAEARCGAAEGGGLYAWLGTTCDGDAECAGSAPVPQLQPTVRRGPEVRHGCSRTPDAGDGTYVECCVAVPTAVKTDESCLAALPPCGSDDSADEPGTASGGGR
jgi:hypothetical protein